jgi:GT2 family glycosyltransferase
VLAAIDLRLANVFRRLPSDWQGSVEQAYVRLLTVGVGELHDPPTTVDEANATRQLSVVVPVHNAPIETERCLQSLERFGNEAEIILVDDGSTDPRASGIVSDFSARNNWKAQRNEKGSFHSAACMAGARLATRPILFLLNSDTVVTQHAFSRCVQALNERPDLMAVGPMTSDGWGTQNASRARRCRFFWNDAQIFWYAERLYRQYSTREPRPIQPFVTGAALFVRRTDWDRVRGFEGCRAHGGNDVDLCLKLTAGGGWIGVCDGAYVHHLGGRSASFI